MWLVATASRDRMFCRVEADFGTALLACRFHMGVLEEVPPCVDHRHDCSVHAWRLCVGVLLVVASCCDFSPLAVDQVL
jgi:hypothetical protein